MDKAALKKEIKKLVDAFREENKPLGFVGISPVFEELRSTPYILKVYASWLEKLPSRSEALIIIIEKMYKVLSKDALRYINHVELCDQKGEVHCETSDVLLNEAGIEIN